MKGDIERRLARLEEAVFPQGATERIMQSFQRWYDEMVSEDIRQEKENPPVGKGYHDAMGDARRERDRSKQERR